MGYALRVDVSTSTLQRPAPVKGEKLKIYTYPAPVLKKVAEPVEVFDSKLEELCHNMLATMYQAPGIGLAAPQVGVSRRVFVVDIDYREEDARFNPLVFVNPRLRDGQGEILYEEGCLSVPGVFEQIKRRETVWVDYQDVKGERHSLKAEGLLAVCLQHENDHLDGIVFLEKLSLLKRNLVVKKFLKKK